MAAKKLSPITDFKHFDSVGVAVVLVDENQKIIYSNNESYQLSLYKSDEILHKEVRFLFAPKSQRQISDLMSLILINTDLAVREQDVLLQRKSGATTHVTLSVKIRNFG